MFGIRSILHDLVQNQYSKHIQDAGIMPQRMLIREFLEEKLFSGTSNLSEYHIKNWIFMESVVFLLLSSSTN
jgi:hypothetical protein